MTDAEIDKHCRYLREHGHKRFPAAIDAMSLQIIEALRAERADARAQAFKEASDAAWLAMLSVSSLDEESLTCSKEEAEEAVLTAIKALR